MINMLTVCSFIFQKSYWPSSSIISLLISHYLFLDTISLLSVTKCKLSLNCHIFFSQFLTSSLWFLFGIFIPNWYFDLQNVASEIGVTWWWTGTWRFFIVKWYLLFGFYFNPCVSNFASNGTERKKMTNQDWRRLHFIYFKNWVHIWAPFFCGPVSPCIHVPVVGHSSTVISSLWLGVALVERGLASLMIQWYLLEGHGAKQES